jgi:hypothetical protein
MRKNEVLTLICKIGLVFTRFLSFLKKLPVDCHKFNYEDSTNYIIIKFKLSNFVNY